MFKAGLRVLFQAMWMGIKMAFDVEYIRKQFPILEGKVYGKDLIYFDSAATTLKPRSVVERMSEHYLYETSNVHRGLHFLSDQATQYFEDARSTVSSFLNASAANEIIFTSGTTGAINFVANVLLDIVIQEGDEVLVSELEHHSNFVPWQMACAKMKAKFSVFEINEDGTFNLDLFLSKLNSRTKVVSISHVSNALGTVFPIKEIVTHAKKVGALVVVDGAQAIAHQKVDVQDLGCDFYAFSGHKLYGPTGIGVLYMNHKIQDTLGPYQFGGGMVDKVSSTKTTFQDPPYKFEAGTPHIAGAIGLAASINFVSELGLDSIHKHESKLLNYTNEIVSKFPEVKVIGNNKNKGPIVSFVVEKSHPSDIGSLLDHEGFAVRSGHHCTQPLMQKYGIPGTVRVSLSIYNTLEEVDSFYKAMKKVIGILKG